MRGVSVLPRGGVGAREALTLSAGLAPPGRGRAVHGARGPHGCREAALWSIGSGRQTWSLAKAPAPRSRHPQEARPSWPGPGVCAPHAVALGAWALHRAGAAFPTLPSFFLLLGRIPRGPTGSVVAKQGAREVRPQPSHPARTPAAGPPVPLTCPAGWCDPSARETVATWQPSPSNLDPGPRGEPVEREGRGPGARGTGPAFCPGSPLRLPRPSRPRPGLRLDPESFLSSLGFMATLHLPHRSPSTWGPRCIEQ